MIKKGYAVMVTENDKKLKDVVDKIRAQIDEKKQSIDNDRKYINQLTKDSCGHSIYKIAEEENFKYDVAPIRVCLICGNQNRQLSDDEKKEFWYKYFDYLLDEDEEFYSKEQETLVNQAINDNGFLF
jgi:hypothetical protein